MPHRHLVLGAAVYFLSAAALPAQGLPKRPSMQQVVGYHQWEEQKWRFKQVPANSVFFKYRTGIVYLRENFGYQFQSSWVNRGNGYSYTSFRHLDSPGTSPYQQNVFYSEVNGSTWSSPDSPIIPGAEIIKALFYDRHGQLRR